MFMDSDIIRKKQIVTENHFARCHSMFKLTRIIAFKVFYLSIVFCSYSSSNRGTIKNRYGKGAGKRFREANKQTDKHRKRHRYGKNGRKIWVNDKDTSEDKRDKELRCGRRKERILRANG